MKFFGSLLVGASALVSLVAAQDICTGLCFTSTPQAVVAGQTYTLEWTAATDDPVTIILREGNSGDLDTIETITTTATGGSFEWTPSTDLENSGSYALQITQGAFENYSGQFPLTGGETPGATPSSTSEESSAAASTTESAAESTAESTSAETTAVITSSIASTGLPTPTNGTATPTMSTSRVPTGPASTTTTGGDAPAETTGAASQLKSPAALVLGAIAALAYLQ